MRLIWKPLGPFLDLLLCNCEDYVAAGDNSFDEYMNMGQAPSESILQYSILRGD